MSDIETPIHKEGSGPVVFHPLEREAQVSPLPQVTLYADLCHGGSVEITLRHTEINVAMDFARRLLDLKQAEMNLSSQLPIND